MLDTATLANIRFGTGLSPRLPGAQGAQDLLAGLTAPDDTSRFVVEGWPAVMARGQELERLRVARRVARAEGGDFDAAAEAIREVNRARSRVQLSDLSASVARLAYGDSPMRERLVRFWANHFAVEGRTLTLRGARSAFVEDAIRPHVTGDFATMLRAAVLHPVMLVYLDQSRSFGPNSVRGKRTGRGLNENLARELLELHTLGVDGAYGQADVTAMAKLLTGVTYRVDEGLAFVRNIAEPGIIEVLGKRYGHRRAQLEHIHEALGDLAVRPDTAQHLAGKLARHFVSDDPDPALIQHIAARYLADGGNLMSAYVALLEHPSAWAGPLAKTRSPLEFMAAAVRALDISPQTLISMRPGMVRSHFEQPMQLMGEQFASVPSPAGYPDAAADWITPQALAMRVQWSMTLAQEHPEAPDPRDFVAQVLGQAASEPLRRAAAGAESRSEGIGVILASPDFSRR